MLEAGNDGGIVIIHQSALLICSSSLPQLRPVFCSSSSLSVFKFLLFFLSYYLIFVVLLISVAMAEAVAVADADDDDDNNGLLNLAPPSAAELPAARSRADVEASSSSSSSSDLDLPPHDMPAWVKSNGIFIHDPALRPDYPAAFKTQEELDFFTGATSAFTAMLNNAGIFHEEEEEEESSSSSSSSSSFSTSSAASPPPYPILVLGSELTGGAVFPPTTTLSSSEPNNSNNRTTRRRREKRRSRSNNNKLQRLMDTNIEIMQRRLTLDTRGVFGWVVFFPWDKIVEKLEFLNRRYDGGSSGYKSRDDESFSSSSSTSTSSSSSASLSSSSSSTRRGYGNDGSTGHDSKPYHHRTTMESATTTTRKRRTPLHLTYVKRRFPPKRVSLDDHHEDEENEEKGKKEEERDGGGGGARNADGKDTRNKAASASFIPQQNNNGNSDIKKDAEKENAALNNIDTFVDWFDWRTEKETGGAGEILKSDDDDRDDVKSKHDIGLEGLGQDLFGDGGGVLHEGDIPIAVYANTIPVEEYLLTKGLTLAEELREGGGKGKGGEHQSTTATTATPLTSRAVDGGDNSDKKEHEQVYQTSSGTKPPSQQITTQQGGTNSDLIITPSVINPHHHPPEPERKKRERKFWLMKSEPDVFSLGDLRNKIKNKSSGGPNNERIGEKTNYVGDDEKDDVDEATESESEPWTGVRNYQARNNMMSMHVGDLVLFYHSNVLKPRKKKKKNKTDAGKDTQVIESEQERDFWLYHPEGSGIAGVAVVTREAYPDHTYTVSTDADAGQNTSGIGRKTKPKKSNNPWQMVDVKYVATLPNYVSLSRLKTEMLRQKLTEEEGNDEEKQEKVSSVTPKSQTLKGGHERSNPSSTSTQGHSPSPLPLEDMMLLRPQGMRLSVQPVTKSEFEYITSTLGGLGLRHSDFVDELLVGGLDLDSSSIMMDGDGDGVGTGNERGSGRTYPSAAVDVDTAEDGPSPPPPPLDSKQPHTTQTQLYETLSLNYRSSKIGSNHKWLDHFLVFKDEAEKGDENKRAVARGCDEKKEDKDDGGGGVSTEHHQNDIYIRNMNTMDWDWSKKKKKTKKTQIQEKGAAHEGREHHHHHQFLLIPDGEVLNFEPAMQAFYSDLRGRGKIRTRATTATTTQKQLMFSSQKPTTKFPETFLTYWEQVLNFGDRVNNTFYGNGEDQKGGHSSAAWQGGPALQEEGERGDEKVAGGRSGYDGSFDEWGDWDSPEIPAGARPFLSLQMPRWYPTTYAERKDHHHLNNPPPSFTSATPSSSSSVVGAGWENEEDEEEEEGELDAEEEEEEDMVFNKPQSTTDIDNPGPTGAAARDRYDADRTEEVEGDLNDVEASFQALFRSSLESISVSATALSSSKTTSIPLSPSTSTSPPPLTSAPPFSSLISEESRAEGGEQDTIIKAKKEDERVGMAIEPEPPAFESNIILEGFGDDADADNGGHHDDREEKDAPIRRSDPESNIQYYFEYPPTGVSPVLRRRRRSKLDNELQQSMERVLMNGGSRDGGGGRPPYYLSSSLMMPQHSPTSFFYDQRSPSLKAATLSRQHKSRRSSSAFSASSTLLVGVHARAPTILIHSPFSRTHPRYQQPNRRRYGVGGELLSSVPLLVMSVISPVLVALVAMMSLVFSGHRRR